MNDQNWEQRVTDRPTGRIEITDLDVAFESNGRTVEAVRRFTLMTTPGEFVALLGPSGCGKTTVLNAVAGFVDPTAGQVLVDGDRVTGPGADRGVVFQQHSLFPWKTALGNVEFGLKMRGVGQAARTSQARRYLNLVGLASFENAYPRELSGGMQQRVGIARVLVNRPRVMLMDEPFGALDAQTRLTMQELLLGVWREVRTTVLFVTHDIDEALFLADRVVVMTTRPGQVRDLVTVKLARPRAAEVIATSEFMALKARVLAQVREESARGLGPHP
jgi:NitT/TauT family transport system ATP-binding protein